MGLADLLGGIFEGRGRGLMVAEPVKEVVSRPLWERLGLEPSELLNLAIRAAVAGGLSYFLIRYMLKNIDPTSNAKAEAKKKSHRILADLGLKPKAPLTAHELQIATALIAPTRSVSFADVGGVEKLMRQMQDEVLFPLSIPLSQASPLLAAPKGVLLYGPPGCGKTLMAKAIASAAGASFLCLDVSTILDKWYGESQKLSSAVFSLAAKLQPTIIFIDEMDAFLRQRSSNDHEATANIKAQFLALWDGFCTERRHRIVVMGATNRAKDIDPAFLRRLPCRYYVGLPDAPARREILRVILKKEPRTIAANLEKIAAETQGFTGSDLHELCRLAVTKLLREIREAGKDFGSSEAQAIPLSHYHMAHAIVQMRKVKSLDTPLPSDDNVLD